MAAEKFELPDLERRMRGAIDGLKRELGGLRTGRASVHFLDPVVVTVYGARMPLNQVASVSVPEPRMISVTVWDRSNLSAVEKGIREANLGINPVIDGTTIRLPVPPLTAERRIDLAKLAHKYAEHTRVAARNVRREGMELLKRLEKNQTMTEDDHRRNSTKLQELTDKIIKEIDGVLAAKESEIKQV